MKSPTSTYTWIRWAGGNRTLEGVASLIFEPAHVTFYDPSGRLLLAERNEQVSELREVLPEASQ